MASSTGRRRVRVALLDESALLLDSLAERLGRRGSGLTVTATATDWAGLVDGDGFEADVAVLSLHLDDGIPIGTKVRALRSAGCSSVVISRRADSGSANSAIAAGALAFVPMTEGAEELVTAIRSAARGEQHLPASVGELLADYRAVPDAGLGRQEQRALTLYAGGRSIKEVAVAMDTTEETVKSYIKRARRKFREVGVDLGTRVLVRRHAIREGWIASE